MFLRVVLTLLGAVLGLIGGGWISIVLAAHYAPEGDVPAFGGNMMGAIFGLLIGPLLVQLVYKIREAHKAR